MTARPPDQLPNTTTDAGAPGVQRRVASHLSHGVERFIQERARQPLLGQS
jgi:hypothetical protein